MSACQIWVWLLNFHQEKTKLLDMQELQVSEQIQYLKLKLNKSIQANVTGGKNLYHHVSCFSKQSICV